MRRGFTLIEVLLAIFLSGMALMAGMQLLDGLIRAVGATSEESWREVRRSRFEAFVVRMLEEASERGAVEWQPVTASPEYRGLDWVLVLPAPRAMISFSDDGTPLLPTQIELGFSRSDGLMVRERLPAAEPGEEEIRFRPLLGEDAGGQDLAILEVVFYAPEEDRLSYEEIDPPRVEGEAGVRLPRVMELRLEGNRQRWVFLGEPPERTTARRDGPGVRDLGGREQTVPPVRQPPGRVAPGDRERLPQPSIRLEPGRGR